MMSKFKFILTKFEIKNRYNNEMKLVLVHNSFTLLHMHSLECSSACLLTHIQFSNKYSSWASKQHVSSILLWASFHYIILLIHSSNKYRMSTALHFYSIVLIWSIQSEIAFCFPNRMQSKHMQTSAKLKLNDAVFHCIHLWRML